MSDVELNLEIAETGLRFTAATLEKQRRESQPTTALEQAVAKHRRLFALLAAFAAIVLGSLFMRLFT